MAPSGLEIGEDLRREPIEQPLRRLGRIERHSARAREVRDAEHLLQPVIHGHPPLRKPHVRVAVVAGHAGVGHFAVADEVQPGRRRIYL